MNTIISTWEFILPILQILLVLAMIPFLAFLGWYAYFRAIPKILKHFAEKQKFVGIIPEFTWAAITVSSVFKYGKINKAGFTLSSKDQEARIVSMTGTEKTTWLSRRGFTWLGFDAPNVTRFAEKEIDTVRMNPNRKESDPLESWIVNKKKKIHNLYLSFPMYVLVENIDTTDTKKVSVLVMAEIEVVIPYLTWYGQGGQAYKVINTRIERRVREVFERYSLLSLILGTKQDEAEQDLKDGVPGCLDLGVNIKPVTIVEWDWKADDAFTKLLEDPKAIEAREVGILREQDLKKAEAEKEVTIAEAKAKAAKALQKVYTAQWKSLLAKFGGDVELARASMLKSELGSEEFTTYQLSMALQKTNVTALGGEFMAMIKPKSKQPEKSES